MKRDWELVRRILFRAEAAQDHSLSSSDLVDAQHDEPSVAAHLVLLDEAGLIHASVLSAERHGALTGVVERLTWDGHEFLETIRSDTVWSKTMDKIRKHGGAATLEIVKGVATAIVKGMLSD